MKKRFIVAMAVLCMACHSNKDEPTPPDKPVDPLPAPLKQADTLNIQHNDTIRIAFAPGKDSITVKAHIDSAGGTVVCRFEAKSAQKLLATINTFTKQSNIRFSQLIMPNDAADGPFGQELKYDLLQNGDYLLVIGPSLMAENPYTGEFYLHVEIR